MFVYLYFRFHVTGLVSNWSVILQSQQIRRSNGSVCARECSSSPVYPHICSFIQWVVLSVVWFPSTRLIYIDNSHTKFMFSAVRLSLFETTEPLNVLGATQVGDVVIGKYNILYLQISFDVHVCLHWYAGLDNMSWKQQYAAWTCLEPTPLASSKSSASIAVKTPARKQTFFW